MKGLTPIVRSCRRGDAAAWRELVRLTLPHVDACLRQVLARVRSRIQPSLDDLAVAVYGDLRRDHGRLLLHLEAAAEWPVALALAVRRAVHAAIGNVEGDIPTRAASDEASRAWKAYRETPLEPWERVVVALFYFRGMRYVDIALLFDEAPMAVSDLVRQASAGLLDRYAPREPGAPPAPARRPDCPVGGVLFDFVHREVSEESRRSLTAHVEGCAVCRAQSEVYRRMLMAMASVQPGAVADPCLEDSDLLALAARRVLREDRERLGRHLAECADCWDAYDLLRAVAEAEPPTKTARLDAPPAERILALGPPVPRAGSGGAHPAQQPHSGDRIRARRKRVMRQIVRRQMLTWGGAGFLGVLALAGIVGWLTIGSGRTGEESRSPARASGVGAGAPRPDARRDPAATPLEIEGIRGTLRIRSGGIGPGVEIAKRAGAVPGDELSALDDGATFVLQGVSLGVREGALRVLQANADDLRVECEEGEAWVRLRPDGPGVQIRTPHGRVETLRRPGYPVAFLVQVWRARTVLVVHDGKARLQGEEGRVEVTKGAWTSVRAGEGPMGIARVDTPPPPAWVESRGDTNPPPPYFDILSPVSERTAAVLIAVPHATREPGVGRVAARMGRMLEAPVLFARWFEPADVIRPQETQWGTVPVPRQTPEARQIFQLYRSFTLRASGASDFPLGFYVELHGDELTGAGPVPAVEVVTRGFEAADLERMRALWDRHPGHPPAIARLPLLIDLLSPVIRSGGRETLFAFGGYPGSFAQDPSATHVRRALIFRLPRLLRFDPEMARRYGEVLADVVKEVLPK
jgi:hypothetical protein